MKKLLTIFLLGALVMYSVGYLLVYRCNLRIIKRQMRSAIRTGEFEADQLVHFTFDFSEPATFKAVEVKDKGKEISYRHKMYDVISVRVEGDRLIVRCIADNDETQLIAGFTKALDDIHSGLAQKKLPSFIKYQFSDFTVYQLFFQKTVSLPNLLPGHKAYAALFIPQHYLNNPSPPPRQSWS